MAGCGRTSSRLLWVGSVLSDYSEADAQVGSANYRFIKSPLTGLAREAHAGRLEASSIGMQNYMAALYEFGKHEPRAPPQCPDEIRMTGSYIRAHKVPVSQVVLGLLKRQ